MASFTLLCFLMLILDMGMVESRFLRLNSFDNLVSDGVNLVNNQSPIYIEGLFQSSNTCTHTYGFFPCADNIGGYIFQIIVYQYLLILGGKLVTKGSKTLFNLIGTGVYGASVFRILLVLPKMVMVIVSGILKNKETAQNNVSSGVSVYAGSTVFSLTLLWGTCVVFGRTEFSVAKSISQYTGFSVSKCLLAKETMSVLKDTGIKIDNKTCYTAGIMLLSLIPYIIVLLGNVINTEFGSRVVILLALVVSITLLLSYFLYQIFDPWIQERSLEYSKYENLLAGFLHHVQKHTKEKLVNENGLPNISVIKRLFAETDKDDDKCITFTELEHLIHDIQSGKVRVDKDYAISEILKAFDLNSDGRIEEPEFIEGCKKLIHDAKQLAESGDSTSRKFLREFIQPSTKKQRNETTEIEQVMAKILKHVKNQAPEAECLLTDDGTANVKCIKKFLEQYDSDNSNSISQSELEQLICSVKCGESRLDNDNMVKKLIEEFDRDGDNIISEEEFIQGLTKWLHNAIRVTNCKDAKRSIDEYEKIMWGEVDNLVYEKEQNAHNLKMITWAFMKPVFQVILGIVILTFLSGPLMTSIQQFSDAIGASSFLISFVIIPVAMNARSAILAIFPASQKNPRTASLTFSEIYGGVVMNNIVGLSTLLIIVYAKDLRWDYSAEVLTVLVVCAIVGVFAYSSTTYPLWSCLLVLFLYPFSLVLYYFLQCLVGRH